jgi:glycosyltransferase involved in cell wall biosynthesis
LLAAIYCRLTGRRVIHHFHDLGTSNRLFPLWVPLVTDFVHNTEFGYRDVARNLPAIKRRRNVVIPYLVKLRSSYRMDLETTRVFAGKRNVFFVGQVSRHKGVDLLVRAFSSLAREHGDLALHLVGGFKGEFRSELDDLVAQAGLTDRVTFWGYREDVSDLLRFAYLYVQSSPPSRFHDCSPLSVIEAMAAGIPTVCFRSGALPEMVVHEKTGLVCDESVASLADAVNRMFENSKFRDACAVAARQRYQELWGPDRIHGSWLRFLTR